MEYLKKGFYLKRKLFSEEELLTVRKEIISLFENFCNKKLKEDEIIKYVFKNDFDAFLGCANLCQNLTSVYKLLTSCKIEKTLAEIGIEKSSVNTRPLISFSSKDTAKSKNYWKVNAHQDWPSTQGSLKGITCWFPLTKMQANMGYLEVVPKSHLLGYLKHENDSGIPLLPKKLNFEFEKIKMNLGDVLFFSNFLIHKSGENKSNKIRLTSHFRFDDCTEKTFVNRRFPKTRIEKRIDKILFPNFPDEKIIHDTFFNDNI